MPAKERANSSTKNVEQPTDYLPGSLGYGDESRSCPTWGSILSVFKRSRKSRLSKLKSNVERAEKVELSLSHGDRVQITLLEGSTRQVYIDCDDFGIRSVTISAGSINDIPRNTSAQVHQPSRGSYSVNQGTQNTSKMYRKSSKEDSFRSQSGGFTEQNRSDENTACYVESTIISGITFILKTFVVNTNNLSENQCCMYLVGSEEQLNSIWADCVKYSDQANQRHLDVRIIMIVRYPCVDYFTVFTPEFELTKQQCISLLGMDSTANSKIKSKNTEPYLSSDDSTSAAKISKKFVGQTLFPVSEDLKIRQKFMLSTSYKKFAEPLYESGMFSKGSYNSFHSKQHTQNLTLASSREQLMHKDLNKKEFTEIKCHGYVSANAESESINKNHSMSKYALKTIPPMTRIKLPNCKVRRQSGTYLRKPYVLTPQDDDTLESLINSICQEEIIRKQVYEFFSNEMKTHHDRPSVLWPSMHPLLPYKIRYLDNNDNQVTDTLSSLTLEDSTTKEDSSRSDSNEEFV